MLKIIIGIFLILLLASFLSPQTREFLNEKVQSIFFKEAKERLKEKELIGSANVYSPRVEEIQKILKEAGFTPGPIDGRMGWQTRKAIREFQESKGLKVTGMVNPETLLELNREKENQVNFKREKIEPITFLPEEKPKDTKSKEDVLRIMGPQDKETKPELPKDKKKQIQMALKNAGFYKGPIDGNIGAKTRQAIKEFQTANGLKADGIVGRRTWEKLNKYLN